jgi:uncharacterized membrane protein
MVVPAPTMYHRLLGWHAPALRRLFIAAVVGLALAMSLSMVVTWRVAVLSGWDAAALMFLVPVWPMIVRTDGPRTEYLATREDINRDTATLLVLVACVASLVAVSFALGLARQETGAERLSLITLATLTIVISWTVVNTVFTLRYAHLYYRSSTTGIDFSETASADQPDYRDFAYLAYECMRAMMSAGRHAPNDSE